MEASFTNRVERVDVNEEGVVPSSVLIRRYGETAGLFRRDADLWNYRLVHSVGLAPKLLAIFEGGRIEEFLKGVITPKAVDMWDSKTSQAIAEHMARFHFMTVRASPWLGV